MLVCTVIVGGFSSYDKCAIKKKTEKSIAAFLSFLSLCVTQFQVNNSVVQNTSLSARR